MKLVRQNGKLVHDTGNADPYVIGAVVVILTTMLTCFTVSHRLRQKRIRRLSQAYYQDEFAILEEYGPHADTIIKRTDVSGKLWRLFTDYF